MGLITERTRFFGCFGLLTLTIAMSTIFIIPVIFQMILYTFPIIYIGSHLSLKRMDVDEITGAKPANETMSQTDAMLFPVIGSVALLTLYIAYKFFDPYWINILLTGYLTILGSMALSELLSRLFGPLCPEWMNNRLSTISMIPFFISKNDPPLIITVGNILAYTSSIGCAIAWSITKHWTLHNIFAVAFCIKVISIISAGTFGIACVLLGGLFVYDIFWVFGTDVMVTVAKSFEGPAKLIFPIAFDPFKYSILGLGDIVIPGILISLCLRFDLSTHDETPEHSVDTVDSTDIHKKFRKFYFLSVLAGYEAGLVTTGIVMHIFMHPQPALLYLVPFCLLSLFSTAMFKGQIKELMDYTDSDACNGTEKAEDTKMIKVE